MNSQQGVFETANLDLAAFLMLEGLKYIGCKVTVDAEHKKPRALIKFSDEKGSARDLERIFINSREKQYRDLTKYLLKEVHSAVKNFSREILEDQED